MYFAMTWRLDKFYFFHTNSTKICHTIMRPDDTIRLTICVTFQAYQAWVYSTIDCVTCIFFAFFSLLSWHTVKHPVILSFVPVFRTAHQWSSSVYTSTCSIKINSHLFDNSDFSSFTQKMLKNQCKLAPKKQQKIGQLTNLLCKI